MEKQMPKVGDFLYSDWGYEQSNIGFYKVIRVSKSSVWVQEWSSQIEKVVGWASEMVVPGIYPKIFRHHVYENGQHSAGHEACEDSVAPIVCKRWSKYGGVRVDYSEFARLWDGKPKYASHYA
jgi:hypothetical protein